MSGSNPATPSQQIVAAARAERVITDAKGRKLTLRNLTILEQVRLLRAIGPAQSNNEPYGNICTMAAGVSEIDGVPLPFPTSESMIDNAVARIGDEGFAALMVDMRKQIAAVEAAALAAAEGGEATPPDPLDPSA